MKNFIFFVNRSISCQNNFSVHFYNAQMASNINRKKTFFHIIISHLNEKMERGNSHLLILKSRAKHLRGFFSQLHESFKPVFWLKKSCPKMAHPNQQALICA